jgi:AraC-like DNA-binding protein
VGAAAVRIGVTGRNLGGVGVANLATVQREAVDYVATSLVKLGVRAPEPDPGHPHARHTPHAPHARSDRRRVPARELVDLWQQAVDESGDTCLGVRVARTASRRDFGVLGDVVLTRRSLAEALVENARLLPLITDSIGFALVTRAERAQYVLEVRDPTLMHPQSAEQVLATVWFWVRALSLRAGTDLDPVVRFAHGRTDPASDHERLLGCRVCFDAGLNAIEIESAALFRPLRPFDLGGPDPVARAERCLDRRRRSTFLALVRQVVGEELEAGATEARVARKLGLHPRTLSRRLAARGTSFRELVETERLARARQLLVTDWSVDHIGRRLGYSDGTAFSRAFKRWTGTSPTTFRASLA